MALVWWEKTVEYMFIWRQLQSDPSAWFSAFAGTHEKAGDAALSANGRWLLIEFKRDRASIADERRKFDPDDFKRAREALKNDDGHHVLVYGVATSGEKSHLGLLARTYFSEQQCKITHIVDQGASLEKFSKYIEEFIRFKKVGASAGAGGLTISDYALVAGVTTDEHGAKRVVCKSFEEFCREHRLNLEKSQQRERGPSGPPM